MQIRITDVGFANFTGHFGNIYFEDGVSEHISSVEAERLGCIVACETMDGVNPSATQRMVDVRNKDLEELRGTGHELSHADNSDSDGENSEEGAKHSPAKQGTEPSLDFTREELEELADKSGITGLRNIGSQHGVKGRSVVEIINELMALKEASVKE